MFEILLNFFEKYKIDCFSTLSLEACKIQKPYLLERCGITDGSVIIMAIPYYTSACRDPDRNLSAYAVAQDYHLFFKQLFDRLLPTLQTQFPKNKFAGFADHSPIDEIHAAAVSGLGIIGANGLLITPKYSSYVFLGEIITDMSLPSEIHEIRLCENCGACQRACPAGDGLPCLSSLTQKKGALSEREQSYIASYGSVWGCDICQTVCPHTKKALDNGTAFSPIPYFSQQTLPRLSTDILNEMDDKDFSMRAYSWRGRETIKRNLELIEKGELSC